jgi:hypothetical protein
MPRPKETEALVQLATRIPKSLHRAVRLHCVETGTTVMHFVVDAIEAKLAKAGRRRRARSSK